MPLLAQKKSSQACEASLWFGNSELFNGHEHDESISLRAPQSVPEESVQPIPELGLGDDGVVRGIGGWTHGWRWYIRSIQDEGYIRELLVGKGRQRRRRRQHDRRYTSVPWSRARLLRLWDEGDRRRGGLLRLGLSGLGLLGFRSGGRVPGEARLDHEVDGVAVLDVVLPEELRVCEGLALEQQPLNVGGRRACLGRELSLDGLDRVRRLHGECVRLWGLDGLERYADRTWRCVSGPMVGYDDDMDVPAGTLSSRFTSGGGGTST